MSFSYWSYWFFHHPELKNLQSWFCLWWWLELIGRQFQTYHVKSRGIRPIFLPTPVPDNSTIGASANAGTFGIGKLSPIWKIVGQTSTQNYDLYLTNWTTGHSLNHPIKINYRKCDKPSSILNWLQLGNIYHFLPFNLWIKRFHAYLVWLRKNIRWQFCILHKLVKRLSNLLPATRRFSICFKLQWSWSIFIPF
jgi:hypothetical protein